MGMDRIMKCILIASACHTACLAFLWNTGCQKTYGGFCVSLLHTCNRETGYTFIRWGCPSFSLVCCYKYTNVSTIETTSAPVTSQRPSSAPTLLTTSSRVIEVTPNPEKLSCGYGKYVRAGTSRIVGGTDARPGQIPWQASLLAYGKHKCGATLISDQWLLTAAHCFDDGYPQSAFSVRLGFTNASSEAAGERRRSISLVVINKDYVAVTSLNDIALLRMSQKVSFSNVIQPACLPHRHASYVGQMCTASGWGVTRDGARDPVEVLQQVALPVFVTSLCLGQLGPDYVNNRTLCAGWPAGGRDACLGDSGGPLICRDVITQRHTIAGVISWGIGCGQPNMPAIYSKVSAHMEWLEDIMEMFSSSATRTIVRG